MAEVGKTLEKIRPILGTHTESHVALYYDWENSWGLSFVQNNELSDKKYIDTLLQHYHFFWEKGINVDIIGPGDEYDYSKYRLIVAPMVYMMPDGLCSKFKSYVENSGCLVATYMTGLVDDDDLCHLGGIPAGELKDVFGLWVEEIDELYTSDSNEIKMLPGSGFSGKFTAIDICEIVRPTTAESLAEYHSDFYMGTPAVLKNQFGQGKAYYIACRTKEDFLEAFYSDLVHELAIHPVIDVTLPFGVTAHSRQDENNTYIFVENYNDTPVTIENHTDITDMETGEEIRGTFIIDKYSAKILKRNR